MKLQITLKDSGLMVPVEIEGDYLENLTPERLWSIYQKMIEAMKQTKQEKP